MATSRNNPDRRFVEIVRALRLAKPHSLQAVSPEGEVTPLALTGQRGRYERAARTLIAMGAHVAYVLDSSGAVTEHVAVNAVTETDVVDATKAKNERTAEQNVRELLKIVVEAQDKVALRYEAMLKQQSEITQQLTNATLNVMKAAGERAGRLESAVVRLTAAREAELVQRERDLRKLGRELADEAAAIDVTPVDGGEGSGAFELSPELERILTVAEKAYGVHKEKIEEKKASSKKAGGE